MKNKDRKLELMKKQGLTVADSIFLGQKFLVDKENMPGVLFNIEPGVIGEVVGINGQEISFLWHTKQKRTSLCEEETLTKLCKEGYLKPQLLCKNGLLEILYDINDIYEVVSLEVKIRDLILKPGDIFVISNIKEGYDTEYVTIKINYTNFIEEKEFVMTKDEFILLIDKGLIVKKYIDILEPKYHIGSLAVLCPKYDQKEVFIKNRYYDFNKNIWMYEILEITNGLEYNNNIESVTKFKESEIISNLKESTKIIEIEGYIYEIKIKNKN